jgi:uncharacterized protein YggU (UPF0235/DUF167 family)
MESDFRFPDRIHRSEVRFGVRLTPRGGTDRVEGVNDEGVLQARVAAPPVGGAANSALIRLLADELVVVEGVSPEGIVARWPGIKL